MLGLTLALRLRDAGTRVTVIEEQATPGGLAAPRPIGGYTWDRFYHVVLLSDLQLRALFAELGLEDQVRWGTTRTGFLVDGTLHSLSSTVDFVRFPPLGPWDKLRLGLTILHAAHVADPLRLEEERAVDWLRRWSGRRTTERLWLPLLRSKLGEHHREASAAFIQAIIARMYQARRSGLKRELFGYVDGGYAKVLARLRAHLEARGVELRCGAPAMAVLDDGDTASVTLRDGTRHQFDAVVLTVPCPRVARLCPQLDDAERERLERVVYQGVACVSLLLRRPLAGYYVTNITDPDLPFTAIIEMTALVDRATFGGHTLVYLPRYLAVDDERWARSDAELTTEFLAGLRRVYPDLRDEDVVATQMARAREVLAVATRRYSADALPPLRTSQRRLFVANSAQIVNGTLNVNETVTLAERQAEALLPFLRTLPAHVAIPA